MAPVRITKALFGLPRGWQFATGDRPGPHAVFYEAKIPAERATPGMWVAHWRRCAVGVDGTESLATTYKVAWIQIAGAQVKIGLIGCSDVVTHALGQTITVCMPAVPKGTER